MDSLLPRRPLLWRIVVAMVVLVLVGCTRNKPTHDATPTAAEITTTKPAPAASGLWAEEADLQPISKPFLWVVDGAQGPVYLMGTIHLGVDARRELPPKVWDSIRSSKTFVMEADLSKINPFALAKYIQLPQGTSLRSQVKPEVWTGLVELTSGVLPEMVLEQSQPWYVNLLIVQQFFPESPPMDLTLADEAKKHGLAMDYLETVEEQFQMLSQLPEAYSIQGLEQSVLETDTLREEIRIMLESYRAGDAARLEELIVNNDAFNTWPKARDTMLMDRNARWVPQIEAYIQQGNVFIAVGLGHLVGDGSVIDRLNKRGHTVRRVAL